MIFEGIDNGSVRLNNIDFHDVRNSGTWATEAIYEVGALDIIKGYGNRIFGRTNHVTKEQAIAIIYRAVGREEDAQRMAELLDNARIADERNTNALSMWSDGYLRLAAEEGLISWQDYNDALNPDQSEILENGFFRQRSATRQEVARWMAIALGIEPIYGQHQIFNNFVDWTSADPHKVPYIEASLVNGMMSGEGNGYFRPLGVITREQMAQIIKNGASSIFPLLGYDKKTGTIEGIRNARDYTQGLDISRKTFNVRNSNGMLHQIVTQKSNNVSRISEQAGRPIDGSDVELIVHKAGRIGNSSLLSEGDRIEYITSLDNKVKFVNVISNTLNTSYIVGKINGFDDQHTKLNLSKIFDLDYPRVDIESRNFSFNMKGRDIDVTYVVSNNAKVYIDGRLSEIKSIPNGTDAIIEIRDNIVVGIKTVELRLREQGVINGIVEENNPNLGFITLYNEHSQDLRTSPLERLTHLKTYSYTNPRDIQILRNGYPAKIEDIQSGDSAYIKLDKDGNIEIISSVDNYIAKYGKVISKRPDHLLVRYDDGMEQILEVKDALVIFDKRISDYDTLREGDRVRLLLNVTDKFTDLKQITIDGSGLHVSNIYKGTMVGLDDITRRMVIKNVQVFENGNWRRTEQKGFHSVELAEDNIFMFNNNPLNTNDVRRLFREQEAYIAVLEDFGKSEKAVFVSFRNSNDTEAPVFDDVIASNRPGSEGEFTLGQEYRNIIYNAGTIIVKDNRLVSGNNISNEDMAYVVANRRYNDGVYQAGVIAINERFNPDFIDIYRGRISQINTNTSVTLGSFSRLNGLNWEFNNTPKTLSITYDTKIVDDNGIVGQRNFIDHGDLSFKDRTVYILAQGTDAILISTAPYGNINVRGEIFEITGAVDGNDEEQEPNEFRIINARVYDVSSFMWKDNNDMTFDILNTSVIIKNNSIVAPSDLKKGDRVRVIKRESDESKDALIVFVE
ncbi:UNVERIFIED_CONTAM: S-layer family protein [Acetivibrio alkalicellulosi]